LKDDESASVHQFIRTSCARFQSKRKTSLQILEEAYGHLQRNGRLAILPQTIIEESAAIHSFLGAGNKSYMLQAIQETVTLFDTAEPFDNEEVKRHRKQTVGRLEMLWDNEVRTALLANPDSNAAFILVLLGQAQYLKKLLSARPDVIVPWEKSGWTLLHVAVQQGSTAVVETLLSDSQGSLDRFKRDVHQRLPVDYAEGKSITKLLE
jgi:hypothetical protein